MFNISISNLEKNFIKSEFCLKIKELDFSSGNIYYISGKNGAGKSVLLKILGNIDSIYKGEVKFKLNLYKILFLNTSNIGFSYLTIKENIELLEKLYNIDIKTTKIHNIFEDGQLDRLSKNASLGMNMKIGLSLVLKENYWNLIILDETLSNIDTTSQKYLLEELANRSNEGCIVIFTGHNIDIENKDYIQINVERGNVYER